MRFLARVRCTSGPAHPQTCPDYRVSGWLDGETLISTSLPPWVIFRIQISSRGQSAPLSSFSAVIRKEPNQRAKIRAHFTIPAYIFTDSAFNSNYRNDFNRLLISEIKTHRSLTISSSSVKKDLHERDRSFNQHQSGNPRSTDTDIAVIIRIV